jgi:hypothetical protein
VHGGGENAGTCNRQGQVGFEAAGGLPAWE